MNISFCDAKTAAAPKTKASLVASLLTGVALMLPAAAAAQTVTPTADTPAMTSNDTIQDIVVTAQRRSERLQNVPIAVSAVTADKADTLRLDNPISLNSVIPSLNVTRTGVASLIYLRGLGSKSVGGGQEQPVGIYLDGLYIPAAYANVLSFNNIERIEVLKGPQGTLFGRNTTAGVIQIVTKDPTEQLSGNLGVGYGNYDTFSGKAWVAGPITDKIGVSLAAQGYDQGKGYGYNPVQKADSLIGSELNFRGKVVIRPDDRTKLTFSGGYFRSRSNYGLSLQPLPGSAVLPQFGNAAFSGDVHDSDLSYSTFLTTTMGDASARVEHEFDNFIVSDLFGYTRSTLHGMLSVSPGASVVQVGQNIVTTSYSNELQVASSPSSPISWVAGLYYYHGNASVNQPLVLGAGPLQIGGAISHQTIESWAPFAQATAPLFSSATKLTLGIRYTSEDRKLYGTFTGPATALVSVSNPKPKLHFGRFTYRAALSHNFTDDVMLYGSVSTGFKSGVYNMTSPTAPPVDPEKLIDYEIGLKIQAFERRLTVNTAAYYYDYTNIQVTKTQGGSSPTLLQNAGAAKLYGVEADVTIVPVRNLTLNASAGLEHTEFTSYPGAPNAIIGPAGTGITTVIDATGNRLPQAPKLTFSAGASYTIPTNVGRFVLNGNFYHNSGFFWEANNRLRQAAYQLVDGSLEWWSPSETFGVQLWAKNLFNEDYYAVQLSNANALDTGGGAPPRTFGATLKAKF